MNILTRVYLIILFCFLFGAMPPVYAAEGMERLKIGLTPERNIFDQAVRYKNLQTYLAKKTEIKISYNTFTSYGDSIDYYMGHKLDGAFFGSLTGLLAMSLLDIEPVVTTVNPDGNRTYHGHLFVRKDSGIQGVADMKGKVMVYVDKATTAGYLFPVAYLKKHGVEDIETFFGEYYFAGSHDATIDAVLNKRADIGVAKSSTFEAVAKMNPRIKSELAILAESAPVPSSSLFLNRALGTGTINRVKEALLNMHTDTDGKMLLDDFGALKFVEASRDDFGAVSAIAQEAGVHDITLFDYYNK